MLKVNFTRIKTRMLSGSLLLGALLALSEKSQSQTLISQNFTGQTATGWTATDVTSSGTNWAYDNPDSRNINAGATAFDADFAIFDSDFFCNSDEEGTLESPAFDASAAGMYMLDFDNCFRYNSGESAIVEVWNGTAWNAALTMTSSNGYSTANHKSINITSLAGGSASAKVRFHFTNGDCNWYWAIDNVVIARLNCTPPAATFTIVPNCADNQFSVSANITSMGSATSIGLSNGTTTYGSPITAPGTYVAGPFTQLTTQTITLINNQNTSCNLVSSPQTYNCAAPSDECSGAITLIPNVTCTPYSGNTNGITVSDGGVSDCEYISQGDQWFSFQATNAEHSIVLSNVVMTDPSAFDAYYGIAVYGGACGAFTEVDCNSGENYMGFEDPVELNLSGLNVGQTYYIKLWKDIMFDEDYNDLNSDFTYDLCLREPPPPPTNDVASQAVELTVGATCSGNSYSNEGATLSAGEPYASCHDASEGEHSVWFKFKAPSSGSVRITTDISPLGTLDDTKLGLFQVSDSSNYNTFQLIGCDDDNGVIGSGYNSTIFTTDLVPNQTYYVEVDGYDATTTGTFCLQVEEINPTMITNSASCTDLQTPVGNNPDYTGWVTLVDADGYLVANVRNPAGGEANEYSGSYNIDGNGFDMPRQDANGRYYLSRNYVITNSNISTPVDVRFYFQQGEIATLAGVSSNETNLSNLSVTKQEDNDCNADFDDANGPTSFLMQSANGNVNAVSWIQVSTSSFSNFYLMGGSTPLQISLKTIAAENAGTFNIVKWTTEKIEAGDYFELERGADAKHFNFISKIAANLKSADYVFNDNNPLQGENFYRLKLVSKDGKSIYSKIVSATVAAGKGFDVFAYPNPTRNSVQVKVSGSENGAVTLSDITGRVVYQSTLSGTEATIDLSKVADGVYFIKYTDSNSMTKTIKINKQ